MDRFNLPDNFEFATIHTKRRWQLLRMYYSEEYIGDNGKISWKLKPKRLADTLIIVFTTLGSTGELLILRRGNA